MWWQYLLVFVGAYLFDVVPFPFLPAFTIMMFLQLTFDLDLWTVIIIGVIASVLGRYTLTLYIGKLSAKYFKVAKNEDIQFLGAQMKKNKWKGQLVVLLYSLLPLPTTPFFVAAGIGKVSPLYVIPAFFVGKFTSDAVALATGKYVAENLETLKSNILSWQSIAGLITSLLLLLSILFIDWRTLIQKKEFTLKFKILK